LHCNLHKCSFYLLHLALVFSENVITQQEVSLSHGDLLLFFSCKLLESNEQESLQVVFDVTEGSSAANINFFSSCLLSKSQKIQDSRFREGHESLSCSDFDVELLFVMVHEAFELSVRLLTLLLSDKDHWRDVIDCDILVIEGEFSKENFIRWGSFKWLGCGLGFRFRSFGVGGNAKSTTGLFGPLRKNKFFPSEIHVWWLNYC